MGGIFEESPLERKTFHGKSAFETFLVGISTAFA
jgi:hypothetical protein